MMPEILVRVKPYTPFQFLYPLLCKLENSFLDVTTLRVFEPDKPAVVLTRTHTLHPTNEDWHARTQRQKSRHPMG
jgi:hypothetical protein